MMTLMNFCPLMNFFKLLLIYALVILQNYNVMMLKLIHHLQIETSSTPSPRSQHDPRR